MRKKTLKLVLTCILLSTTKFVEPIFAQSSREILTNPKIVELVRLGLDENIIVEKIRQSQCQCDTSTEALGKLKFAKVPNSVIMAMMNGTSSGKPYTDSVPDRVEPRPTENNQGLSSLTRSDLSQMAEPGIYLSENGKMTFLEPTVYSGSKAGFLGTVLTYGIKKSKIRAVVRGKSANTQVSSRRPEFYFVFSREYSNPGAVMSGFGGYAATSPNEFIMLSMNVKSNSREATLGEFNSYSTSTGALDKEIREFSFEKLKPGLYRVTPKVDLDGGEYCFHYAGTSTGTKLYDFGVRQ